jgi:murein DD-endopeptidase MepM/ murein hydrolase activator NlpD
MKNKNKIIRYLVVGIVASLLPVLCINNAVRANLGFTTSAGIYRVPYSNGSSVTAINDHLNHPGEPNRVDLSGPAGALVVAAATGTIRGIVDRHGNTNGLGDGLSADGLHAQDDNLEHSCEDDTTVWGDCQDYNNYVWIEHPNGEWTKYTHMRTKSVTSRGWHVNDVIGVGQALGVQGDVGAAGGPHVHFEVAAIPADEPRPPFSALGGFIPNPGWNVVTRVCFLNGDDNGDGLYTRNETYTAAACPASNSDGVYVDCNFIGTQTGTIESPFRTIGAAINSFNAATYRYVWLKPCTYNEQINSNGKRFELRAFGAPSRIG